MLTRLISYLKCDHLASVNKALELSDLMQARSKHKMTEGAEQVAHINLPPLPLQSLG